MKTIFIKAGTFLLNIIYSIMKCFPKKNRIVFISRQSNSPSKDIEALGKFFTLQDFEIVCLCRLLEGNVVSYIGYCFHMLKQMKAMATSKVVVLDSYCIPACILKHRENQIIVQMWHALGSLKKFSMSILDQDEGRSSTIAKAMKMHENYDCIFTSSEASRNAFADAFGYSPEKLTVMSLPRVDVLLDKERDARIRADIIKHYPQLNSEKKTILYAPTFRKNFDITKTVGALIDAIDKDKYNLVIKMHPLTKGIIDSSGAIVDNKFSSMDMFCACDYVVTDYSAVTYEAALKGKPLFFYAFDIDEYEGSRSFYIDYEKEMPGVISSNPEEIAKAIDEGKWNKAKIQEFADKYIEKQKNCTEEMGQYILNLIDNERCN